MSSDVDARIWAAAGRGGVVPWAALRSARISPRSLDARTASGMLLHPAPGCYVVAAGADEWTALCVQLARSGALAASFEAAAALYGWDGFDRPRPGALTDRALVAPWTWREDHRRFRRRDLAEADVRVVDGIRVTSPGWTLAHLEEAPRVHRDLLEQAVECALRNRQVDEDTLWAQGARMLASVLARRGRGTPPTGSLLETIAVQRVLRRFRLRVVARQVDVFDGDSWQARPDFLLEGWTVLEVDGSQHELGMSPAFDKDRDLRLGTLGLHVLRSDWSEVTAHPARLAARIGTVVELRRRDRPAEPPLAGGALRLGRRRSRRPEVGPTTPIPPPPAA